MNVPALNNYQTIEQGLLGNNISKNLIDFLASIFSKDPKTSEKYISNNSSLKTQIWSPIIGTSAFFTKSYIWEGIIIGEQKSLGVLKKVYKNTFIYHFWNLLTSPVI